MSPGLTGRHKTDQQKAERTGVNRSGTSGQPAGNVPVLCSLQPVGRADSNAWSRPGNTFPAPLSDALCQGGPAAAPSAPPADSPTPHQGPALPARPPAAATPPRCPYMARPVVSLHRTALQIRRWLLKSEVREMEALGPESKG